MKLHCPVRIIFWTDVKGSTSDDILKGITELKNAIKSVTGNCDVKIEHEGIKDDETG